MTPGHSLLRQLQSPVLILLERTVLGQGQHRLHRRATQEGAAEWPEAVKISTVFSSRKCIHKQPNRPQALS